MDQIAIILALVEDADVGLLKCKKAMECSPERKLMAVTKAVVNQSVGKVFLSADLQTAVD